MTSRNSKNRSIWTMRRCLLIASSLAALFYLNGCNQYPRSVLGYVRGTQYKNDYFKFTLPIPTNWIFVPHEVAQKRWDSTLNSIMKTNPPEVYSDKPQPQKLVCIVLMFKQDTSSPSGVRSSIMLQVRRIPPEDHVVLTGSDEVNAFIGHHATLRKDRSRVKGPYRCMLGTRSFDRADLRIPVGRELVCQSIIAGMMNEYMFIVTLTAPDASGLQEIDKMLDRIVFSDEHGATP